jgi:XTP/dITP diphosphohydrolase
MSRLLVLGTHNRKKGQELLELLAPHGFELKTLADFPHAVEVVEDGETFAANAALKATQQARHLGHWVLGEDSGICVDALDGRPGVYSARFAGEGASDEDNNRRLLEELGDLPPPRRTAHYVCHVTLSDPRGEVRLEAESQCRGRIRFEPAGNAGFGYDPLFEIVEYHRTFGQLGDAVKSVLSHRSRALRQFVPQLLKLAAEGVFENP